MNISGVELRQFIERIERLEQEKKELSEQLKDVFAEARAEGDLSENAEFDSAIEAQGMLEARMRDLEGKLASAQIVDMTNIKTDRVVFGCKVTVKDLDFGDEEDYTLVGPGEEDYEVNKILATSPVGKGLVGKMIGEEAEIPIPKGVLRLKIMKIVVAD